MQMHISIMIMPMDLRQYTISEQLGGSQVVKLASGLSNLISEADLFHNY